MPRGVYNRGTVDASTDAVETQVEIATTGSVAREDLVREIEPQTDMTRFESKADELKFMEEPVTIFLHETNNPNEEPVVAIGVNGDNLWLQRGREHVVKRKHVLNLVTARPTSYTTVDAVDRDGARTVNLRSHTALKYPFSVIKDTSRGQAWFQRIQSGR